METSSLTLASRGLGRMLAAAGMVVVLAACGVSQPPTSTPTPRLPAATTSTPQPTVSRSPSAGSPSPLPPGDYTGARPMPARDGRPMLWPVSIERTVFDVEGWDSVVTFYGFVDASAALVVPPRYEGYEFCRDASGRATLVLASSGDDRTDVLDLTGKVVERIPGRFAACIGDTHALFQTDISELGPAEVGNGLFDLRTQEVLLPVKKGRYAIVLDARHVNVHDAKGEYFLDLATRTRTPHPGYVRGEAENGGTELVVASLHYPSGESDDPQDDLKGYLDGRGTWALRPRFVEAQPFHDGYGIVGDAGGEHLIDASFRTVGDVWHSIFRSEWGYQVSRQSGGVTVSAILAPDATTIVEPTTALVDCGMGEDDTCAVYPESGPPQLVLVRERTVTNLPEGFSQVLSRTLMTDGPPDGSGPASRVHNAVTGTTFALDTPASCLAVGTDWLSCRADDSLPATVYTASGGRTEFRDIAAVPDATEPGDAPYYWATQGRYRGFVDAAGRWLYRESRYTTLED